MTVDRFFGFVGARAGESAALVGGLAGSAALVGGLAGSAVGALDVPTAGGSVRMLLISFNTLGVCTIFFFRDVEIRHEGCPFRGPRVVDLSRSVSFSRRSRRNFGGQLFGRFRHYGIAFGI